MVLEDYRKQADPYLNPIASYFVHTHPNTMTWLAFVFAVLAGLTFVATNFIGQYSTAALFLAAALIFLNAIFDALDGKVARLSKRESRRGDFLDHVLDRYADLFIIGGMTISPFCVPWIGVLAIVGVIFASYMGTQAQAVGIRRNYGGLLGRSDRLVLLIFVPLIQMFLEMARLVGPTHHFPVTLPGATFQLSVIEIMMVWFAIAGNATAIQRAGSTWNELARRELEPEDPDSLSAREARLAAQEVELRAMQSDLETLQKALVERTYQIGSGDDEQGSTKAKLTRVIEALAERDRELTQRATDLAAAMRKLKSDRDALEAERGTEGKGARTGPEAQAPGQLDIADAEEMLDKGTLSLSDATSRLRSARLAIERDMRDLKEKELRLEKLQKRIERRHTEAGRK